MTSLKLTRDKFEVYFTSDPHYGHKNLVLGETKWIKPEDMPTSWKTQEERKKFCFKHGVRDFKTTSQMNALIVERLNDTVKEDDHLFILGDIAFGPSNNLNEFMSSIVCKNRYLTFGNHDKDLVLNRNGERGYFRKCDSVISLTVDGQYIFLSHYSHRVWNKSHRDAWHLYGHSHNKLESGWGKSMDVGVDTNDFEPYSFTDVKKILDKVEIKVVDDHGRRED